jgi:hypothetical protein
VGVVETAWDAVADVEAIARVGEGGFVETCSGRVGGGEGEVDGVCGGGSIGGCWEIGWGWNGEGGGVE